MDDRQVALDHTDAKRRVEETATLDGLAHALSHDVRAAFRSTHGFAQIVATRAADTLVPDDLALLQRVVDASRRGTEMLDQLVMWLRTAQHDTKFRDVDLAFLLDWSASELAAGELDLTVEGSAEVQGDEHLLKRLFDVLLSNARKFSADAARPARVHVQFRQDEQHAHIRMHDAGIGIDAQHAERAFEPFVRIHPAENHGGQGLGLAMAKLIVEKHAGSISLSPAPEGGSVVVISLPNDGGRS
ncbi:sensor histidine kinase [Lysobacter soyae]|uniref:histidine kinase n=1 Tax=Lysobacter soyae TaxID=2764185 RepID=A0ABX8WN91_9GAMM|nr:HAMP domain-containing sensor histidine kinase [Lysobacter sp. CJ11]QYR53095.1 HAMP domain-containing histidine kinase [Lysobacter sp. CJ11]